MRFGVRNTRYKDVYDICYLSERVNMEQLKDCIQKYIFDDPTLRNVSDMKAVTTRIELMFTNPGYLRELHKSDKNWLDIPDEAALEKDLAFIKSITF